MNPLEFIFTLIEKYVPVNPGRYEALKAQAKLWYYGGTSDKGESLPAESEKSKIGKWIKDKGEIWYVQLALAFGFLFAAKFLHDIVNEKSSDQPGL
jgi:hypothetical protein